MIEERDEWCHDRVLGAWAAHTHPGPGPLGGHTSPTAANAEAWPGQSPSWPRGARPLTMFPAAQPPYRRACLVGLLICTAYTHSPIVGGQAQHIVPQWSCRPALLHVGPAGAVVPRAPLKMWKRDTPIGDSVLAHRSIHAGGKPESVTARLDSIGERGTR